MWYLCSILYHMESKFSFTRFTPDEEKKILFDFIAIPSSDPQRWQRISIISFRFTVITFHRNTGMGGENLKSLLRADILVYLQMVLLMNNPLSLASSPTLHHVPCSPRLCKLTLILVTVRGAMVEITSAYYAYYAHTAWPLCPDTITERTLSSCGCLCSTLRQCLVKENFVLGCHEISVW